MLVLNRFFPFIIVTNFLVAQTISTVDTIQVSKGQQSIMLQPFIIDSSLFVFNKGKLVDDLVLNTISGEIRLAKPAVNTEEYIISYKYLAQPLPIKIGPLYIELLALDSLMVRNKPPIESIRRILPNNDEQQKTILATTGTIYRNISVSPIGGSDFSGGLQLQLQGQLSDDITVSGVLSDQSIPIQPEGTTQTLDEIDKVYLHVKHPIFQIIAGDIDYSINTGKYLNVNRKLEGLRGELEYNDWAVQATLASSQGRYFKLEFKGSDGSQGPYALTSETGNRDIIVLAGTEKVYVNGEIVKRGENFDYTIDYSTAEITFTPRILIDFDTDIYVEYQYSDYQYSRNVISSAIKRKMGKWGSIGFSWLKEKDVLDTDEISDSVILDSLEIVGDNILIASGAKQDEDGKYILLNGKYIYSPDNQTATKYSVIFQNDNENGEYIRQISDLGEIYFEYVNEVDRADNIDLYVPYTTVNKPVNHELYQFFGSINTTNKFKTIWDISLSNLDKNIYSNVNDDDNLGLAYNVAISGAEIKLFQDAEFDYGIINWQRYKNFNEISNERDPLFNREWNIDNSPEGQESLLAGNINVKLNELLKSSTTLSQYISDQGSRDRLVFDISGGTKFIPKYYANINHVNSDSTDFYQYVFNTQLFSGNFHPTFSYSGEYEEESYRFDVTRLGFIYSKNKNILSASITQRKDQAPSIADSSKLELTREDLFGEFEISGKVNKYWSGEIIFKKRISNNQQTYEALNYAIGTANLRYVNKLSPVRWELLAKLEETYTESRAVVYDSVGTGLGSYRYDEEFNEYISDSNGDYISYTVLTGARDLTTHFNSSQRFYIDFGKTESKLLKDFDIRSDFKAEYRGQILTIEKLFSPSANDDQISNSKINIRNEIDYNTSKRRIRNWHIFSQNLTGTDPRGNDLRKQSEYVLEWREPIVKNMNSLFNIEYHKIDNSSNISELRNRMVNGFWVEEQVKWSIDKNWQFALSTSGGQDAGLHNNQKFDAFAYGIKFEGKRFIKSTTSLKVLAEFYNTVNNNNNTVIPPEALNGLPIGKSLALNFQGQILIGKNLSLNSSLSYIDNSRYDDFLTISGELRAYF